jgi:dTDP-glucose pyrophosphorylase
MSSDLLKKHPQIAMPPTAKLRAAMKVMTEVRFSAALVVDKERRLLGIITDIDVRKALLAGKNLDCPVSEVMNPKPVTVSDEMTPEQISNAFRERPRAHIPIVDRRGRLKGLAAMVDYALIPKRFPNRIVVMAGGYGKRLLPLTENTPKPMLRLGDKPILEHLLEQLISSGFGHFVFTVNYVAEEKPLGTAGALRLVPARHLKDPLLVVNGDILTKVNFAALLDFHKTEQALATLCVKHHEIQVPYGVVELNEHRLEAFVEKPVQRWLVNAGIYVVEPKTLRWLPRNRRCDMPEFISAIRKRRKDGVACFPIQEYWLDIGGHKEFERANGEFEALSDNA